MFDVIFAYFCFVPWVNHHENHHLGEHISTFSKHLKQIHAHMFFKFVLPQMLSVGFFLQCTKPGQFPGKNMGCPKSDINPYHLKKLFHSQFSWPIGVQKAGD